MWYKPVLYYNYVLFIILQIMFATKDDDEDGPGIIAITSDQSYSILNIHLCYGIDLCTINVFTCMH